MSKTEYPRGKDALPAELEECYTKLFSTDEEVFGKNSYDTIIDHPILFPLQRVYELEYMMRAARTIAPKVVFEIGTDKAGGLYHWCKCLPSVERVIACEVRGTPYAELFEQAFSKIDFLWLPKSSYSIHTVEEVHQWLNGDTIDCMFIDGDKSYFHKDFFSYETMLTSPGIVFFHDIQDGSPRTSFNRVVDNTKYSHYTYINTEESEAAAEREARGISATTVHEEWLRHWKGRSAGLGIIEIQH